MSSQAPPSAAQAFSRPPVTLGSGTHLDPGAYVRGRHAITLGENILVHPRAQLVAIHGPLLIGDKTIISEKCVIGGPVPSNSTIDPAPKLSGSNPPSPLLSQGADNDERDPVKTVVEQNVYIHASSHLHAGATIQAGVLIESHVTILANVTIGTHAKICAGVTVDRNVEDWTVVYGNGDIKRQRQKGIKKGDDESDDALLVEMLRLKAVDAEREGSVALLRAMGKTAKTASLAKKK